MAFIKLNTGALVEVNDDMYDYLVQYSWSENRSSHSHTSYAHCRIDGKPVYMHRLIMGTTETKIKVDHKDHNGLNNKRENLEEKTHQHNMLNRRNKDKTSSKYMGVFKQKDRNKFRASYFCPLLRNRIYIGSFDTELEAAKAYDRWVKMFDKNPLLNFPEEQNEQSINS